MLAGPPEGQTVSKSAKLHKDIYKGQKSQMANFNGFHVNSYGNTQSRSKIRKNETLEVRNNKSTTSFYSAQKIQQKKWPNQGARQLVPSHNPLKIENSKMFQQNNVRIVSAGQNEVIQNDPALMKIFNHQGQTL